MKRQSREEEESLKKEIEMIEESFEHFDQSTLEGKKKLETVRSEKIKGVIIRSRAQWLNDGEKTFKYLSSLEKHLYTEKTA